MKISANPSSLIYSQFRKQESKSSALDSLENSEDPPKLHIEIPSRSLIRASTVITKPFLAKKFIDLQSLSIFQEHHYIQEQYLLNSTPHFFSNTLDSTNNTSEYRDAVLLRSITPYEKIETYTDRYPLLDLRKAFLRVFAAVSEISGLIVKSSLYEAAILCVILMNISTLALEGTSAKDEGVLASLELFYLFTYTIEASLKIFSCGLIFARKSYMRDPWNYLDLSIIVSGWVGYLGSSSVNLTGLRTLRILRPLRGITSIRGLKVIVLALITSIKPLAASFGLLGMYLLIFAVAGVQIWSGLLRWQCIEIDTGMNSGNICGFDPCTTGFGCANGLDNPNFGVTSFDNILYGLLLVFQCVTREGWTDIMLFYEKAYNRSAVIFFVLLVFIGSYLLVNLTLVVIKAALTTSIKELKPVKIDNNAHEYVEAKVIMEEIKKSQTKGRESLDFYFSEEDNELVRVDSLNILDSDPDNPEPNTAKPFLNRMSSLVTERNIEEPELRVKKLGPFSPTAATGELVRCNSIAKRLKNINSNRPSRVPSMSQLRRTNSLQDITPMICRMNSSVKISQDLMNIMKRGEELEGIMVPTINSFEIGQTSKTDLLPGSYLDILAQSCGGYVFNYRIKRRNINKPKEKEKEKEKGGDVIQIFDGDLNISSKFKIFDYNSIRFGRNQSFHRLKLRVKKSIEDVQKYDKISQNILGEWTTVNPKRKQAERYIIPLNSMTYTLWKSGLQGIWQKLRRPIYGLVQGRLFGNFISICILVNTVVLSIEYYQISYTLETTLSIINSVFTFIFVSEQVLKLLGLGLRDYVRDTMNYLDLLVVCTSIAEFVFISGGKSVISAFRAVRIFKLLRVLRIARLFRYLQSMNHIVIIISRSISKFAYVAILMFLFIVVYSLLGMQLFAGKLNFPRQSRASFDQFYLAFLSVFQLLTIENWHNLLFDVMTSSVGPGSAVFILSWVALGNFILLNLFLAILLDAFTSEEEFEPLILDPEAINSTEAVSSSLFRRRSSLFGESEEKTLRKRAETMKIIEELPELNSDSEIIVPDYLKEHHRFDRISCERSFYIFPKTSPLRIFLNKIHNSDKFEKAVLILIIISSLKLVTDTYTYAFPLALTISWYFDVLITLCFILEFLIKSINTGFFLDEGSYLKDNWNMIDFGIVVLSVADILMQSLSITYIKVFRLFRTLRPLRFISRNESMKLVLTALLESLVAIFNVVLVCLIIWVMFAILGVSLFSGKLYSCSNTEITTMNQCLAEGYIWSTAYPNYDNLINAMITLFIVSSEENWPNIMYAAIDATDIGKAPQKNYNPLAGLYFVCFIFIGNFFFMNLFIGVVFEQFNEAKKHGGSFAAVLSKDQILWVELQQLITKASPHLDVSVPRLRINQLFYRLTKHPCFEGFIMVCILLNMLEMAIVYEGASDTYNKVIENLNLSFTSIFILEACLKLIGNGPSQYFKSQWNRFDFFVAVCSLVDLIITYIAASSILLLRSGPQMIKTIRLLRLSRLFRLFKSLDSLQTLLIIMKYSLPAILNVLSLLLLIFFIYAVMGVYLFSDITSGLLIDDYVNFSNFDMALLVLFRSATGETWYLIMYDCSQKLGQVASNIYFCSFVGITTFIMLNLFTMVILQHYDDYQSNPNSVFKVFNKDLKKFKAVWRLYASEDGLSVSFKDLPEILYDLGESLGVQRYVQRDKVFKLLSVMEIQIQEREFVYYNDFLFSVMKRKYGSRAFKTNDKQSRKILANANASTQKKLKQIRERFVRKVNEGKQASKKSMNFFIGMVYARTVFNAWRHWAHERREKAGEGSMISITARPSLIEYPGEVSERSSFIESIESYSSSSNSSE